MKWTSLLQSCGHSAWVVAAWIVAMMLMSQSLGAGETREVVPSKPSAAAAHWSFQPVTRPPLPASRSTDHASRISSPVDAFVSTKLAEKSAALHPEADRRTLIRRVWFDLMGLPPSPEEVEAFMTSADPHAYERLVNRLLESPHYGERWGRHWLDVAGFAESSLFIGDIPRQGFWRYRDYVIRAFNADKPFDQFVTEQLAGDELFNWRTAGDFTPEQIDLLAATGFLRCTPDATDNQAITQMDKRFIAQQSAVEVSLKALLGLTINCVRCHDHKFDPIQQEEYYRLIAVFQPLYDPEQWLPGIWSEGNPGALRAIPLLPADERRKVMTETGGWFDERQELAKQVKSGIENQKAAAQARLKAISERNKEVFKDVIWAAFDATTHPSPTRLLNRGNYEAPGKEVKPGVIAALDAPERAPRFDPPPCDWSTGRRLALARWLTHPRHPLVARVMVNRIWQYHFGVGLVSTPDDFGTRGSRPVSKELLDWLAAEFVENGWSVKHIHRLILNSAAYRQQTSFQPDSSVSRKADHSEDHESGWAAFIPGPRRLEAEVIRDAMIDVTGRLDKRLFGASVPTERRDDGSFDIKSGHAERLRRSVYIHTRRTYVPTFLTLFDEPQMDTNWPKRSTSAIAQQALALMNDPFVIESAGMFARRVIEEGGVSFEGRLRRAFALAYQRAPMHDELAAFAQTTAGVENPWPTICQALFSSSEFLYAD